MNHPAENRTTGDSPAGVAAWQRRLMTAALAGYWCTLFVLTHIPMPDVGDLPLHADKVMHFVAYGGLSFLLGLRWSLNCALTPAVLARVFGITAGYAVVDELLQEIPFLHRTGDVYDALADCCGSVIGLTLLVACTTVARRVRWKTGKSDRGKE